MLDFKSDDKEELEQNMREIKSMIQDDGNRQDNQGIDDLDFGGEQNQEPAAQNPQNNQQQENRVQNNRQAQNQQRNQNQQINQQSQNNSPNNKQIQNPQDNQGPQNGGNQGDINEQESVQNQQAQNQGTEKMKVGQIASKSEGNSQAPEEDFLDNESENNSNERKKIVRSEKKDRTPEKSEPLFLREENFVKVREMVEEMGYLASELQENLDDMKKTVHKEKEAAREVNDVVKGYSERRSDIENIIKTGQK